MRKAEIPVLLLFIVILSSCEGGYRSRNSLVVDDLTGDPLDSVLITSYVKYRHKPHHYRNEKLTTEDGKWSASTGLCGCAPRCPDLIVTFSKVGYQVETLKDPPDSTVVRLRKQ